MEYKKKDKEAEKNQKKKDKEALKDQKKKDKEALKDQKKKDKEALKGQKKKDNEALKEQKKKDKEALKDQKKKDKEAAKDKSVDGRHIARANETKRIKLIVNYMNDPNNEIGKKMCADNCKKYNKDKIIRVEKAGSNSDHYDFTVYYSEDDYKRIEEKHSKKKLNTNAVPWKNSGQIFNGIGKHFIVGHIYTRLYYDIVICKTNWCKILKCSKSEIPDLPEYEEWVEDAFRCGDPKTPWGCFIKSRFRALWPGESFTGRKNTPDLRSELPEFKLTDEQTQTFIEQINDKFGYALSQKDGFLQTKGDINSDNFEFAWRDPVPLLNITTINIRHKKDIFFDLINDNGYNFTGTLRWGKGVGFTNIRLGIA